MVYKRWTDGSPDGQKRQFLVIIIHKNHFCDLEAFSHETAGISNEYFPSGIAPPTNILSGIFDL